MRKTGYELFQKYVVIPNFIFASSGFAYNFYFRNRTEAAQLRNTIDHEIIKRESLTRELLKQKDEVLKYTPPGRKMQN